MLDYRGFGQLCFHLFNCCLFAWCVRGHPVDLIFQNQAGDKLKMGNLNWEQGKHGPGHLVKVTAVKEDCRKQTLGLLRVNNTELEFCDGDRWRKVVTKRDNSPENPGSTCRKIKNEDSGAGSGVYWLDPNGGNHSDAFQAFCDMKSFGGGWTMCYTANNPVKLTAETSSPGIGYGANGYRSNCNNIPFTEIMFVDEGNQQRAYFSRSSGGKLVANGNYEKQANAYGLWDGHGVASTSYKYQLNICHNSFYSGFMVSGYTNCYKHCGSWCGDTRSDYYRTSSTSKSYAGVAFKTNGHKPVPQKSMSVGLR